MNLKLLLKFDLLVENCILCSNSFSRIAVLYLKQIDFDSVRLFLECPNFLKRSFVR